MDKQKNIAIVITIMAVLGSSWYGISKRPIDESGGANDSPSVDLTQVEDAISDVQFESGKNYYNAGDFKNAILELEKVTVDSPNFAEAQIMFLSASANYCTEILNIASSYAITKDYKTAIGIINDALLILPEDDDLKNAITVYKENTRIEAIAAAELYAEDDNCAGAIAAIQDAVMIAGEDARTTAKLYELGSSYSELAIEKAKEQFDEYDAESLFAAEEIIKQALISLPDDEHLKESLNYYIECEPVDIMSSDLLLFGDRFSKISSVTDSNGTEYKNAIYVRTWDGRAGYNDAGWWYSCIDWIENNYQYSKITGTLFQNIEYATAPTKTHLKFFENGTLWEGNVSGGIEPLEFCFDVSQNREIAFALSAGYDETDPNREYHYAYIANLYLWK